MIKWTRKTWVLLKGAMLLSQDDKMNKKNLVIPKGTMLLSLDVRMDKKDVGATKNCNVIDTIL